MPRYRYNGCTVLLKDADVLQISGIIDETNEMDGVVLGEMPQLMEGADLFAFIGRVGDTMGKI